MGILTYLNPNVIKDSSIGRTKLIEIPDYETFDDITKLSSLTAKRLLYVGDNDVNVKVPISVNSSIEEIDFQGKKINFSGYDAEQIAFKGHPNCKIKNLSCVLTKLDYQKDANVCISKFGYVENVSVDCWAFSHDGDEPYVNKSVGFLSCDHLYNCKVSGGGVYGESGIAWGYRYCNYLNLCRYKIVGESDGAKGFDHCQFISQCYVNRHSGEVMGIGTNSNVESLIWILADGSFETFSDIDHITVGGYDTTNMFKTISSVGGTGKTKLYAKPDDKSGIATVLLDTTPVNWAVARRTSKGTIKAKDAIEDDDLVTKNQLDTLEAKNTELTNTITALEPRVTNAVQITYAELKSLRDAGKLVPGTQYRITDYTCTTTQANTKSAGHIFDIIVTADDESTLNEEARTVKHEGDAYFANSDLNAWKLWYCLDNDVTRFTWAFLGELIDMIKPTTGSASGTYTYTSPISNIMFYGISYNLEIGVKTQTSGPPVYITKTDNYTLVVEDTFNLVGTYDGISVYTVSQKGKGVIYRMIDEFNNDAPYDFKNIQFKHPNDTSTYPHYYYTFASNNVEDNTDNSLSISNHCYSNTIRECTVGDNRTRTLNRIIFIGNNCYSNSFGNDCYFNSFGNSCNSNSFGNNCYSNSFGNGCGFNSFGNNCYNNSFGNSCNYIKFAANSSTSTMYNYYANNHFGNDCWYIVFTGVETASGSAQVQNYNFAQGLGGTSSGAYLTIDGIRNRAYETKVAKNSNGEIKIYCEADLIL